MKGKFIVAGLGLLVAIGSVVYLGNQFNEAKQKNATLRPAADDTQSIGEIAEVGHVTALDGSAAAISVDGSQRELSLQSSVFLNETIQTGSESKLQITLNDGSTLNQGENGKIVIDAFVYDPDVAGRNKCRVNVLQGVFRTVTDGITRLNPDHFKVKTRMATIGIRGCEVGVDMTDSGESVYIIGLPEGHSILVATDQAVQTEAYSITPH